MRRRRIQLDIVLPEPPEGVLHGTKPFAYDDRLMGLIYGALHSAGITVSDYRCNTGPARFDPTTGEQVR